MNSSQFIESLKSELQKLQPNRLDALSQNLRPAAVLVPFTQKNLQWDLILTKRTGTVSTHKHQVAFPGGGGDPSDKNLTATALRETFEEIGIPEEQVSIWGHIDDRKTISNYVVTPVIGEIVEPLNFSHNPHEIETVFKVPLDFFLEDSTLRIEQWSRSERNGLVYFWEYEGQMIWGATAMILVDVISLVKGTQWWESKSLSESKQEEFFRQFNLLISP